MLGVAAAAAAIAVVVVEDVRTIGDVLVVEDSRAVGVISVAEDGGVDGEVVVSRRIHRGGKMVAKVRHWCIMLGKSRGVIR